MGSGCSSCRYEIEASPVNWFSPTSPDSLKWQTTTDSFGQGRNKPFIKGLRAKTSLNRRGNETGQLGGKVIFYQNADRTTNYGLLAKKQTDHVFLVNRNNLLFCKAFFKIPLGRTPIGENNISVERTDLKGQGPVLLAPCPKVIALFVTVDGIPQTNEVFCKESVDLFDEFYDEVDIKSRPITLNKAVQGSFITFMVSRLQDGYFFLHIPVIATFFDSFMDVGAHGRTSTKAFVELFSELSPGRHVIEIKVKTYYDHCDYNYFPLNKNRNALGLWYDGLTNDCLVSPHPDPQNYVAFSSQSVAKGSCIVEIPPAFKFYIDGILDRKPPRGVYRRMDIEAISVDTKIVAAGKYSGTKEFGVEGMPDAIILQTDRRERILKHKDTGYRYRYEYLEFAALWANKKNVHPDAYGVMVEGCMARGEMKPRQNTKNWVWHPITKHGEMLEPERLEVKNKYIKAYVELHRQRAAEAARREAALKEALPGTLTRTNSNLGGGGGGGGPGTLTRSNSSAGGSSGSTSRRNSNNNNNVNIERDSSLSCGDSKLSCRDNVTREGQPHGLDDDDNLEDIIIDSDMVDQT